MLHSIRCVLTRRTLWHLGHSTTDQPPLTPSFLRFCSNLMRGVILHAKNIGRSPRSLRSIVFWLLPGAISEVTLVIKYSWAYNSETPWSINGFLHIIRFAKAIEYFCNFKISIFLIFEIINSWPFFVDLTWPFGPIFSTFYFVKIVVAPLLSIYKKWERSSFFKFLIFGNKK